MKRGLKASWKTYLLEFIVYGVLVVGYYFLVLHLLGDWLHHLFKQDRTLYALTALGLIAGQGILLELLTTFLLGLIAPAEEEP